MNVWKTTILKVKYSLKMVAKPWDLFQVLKYIAKVECYSKCNEQCEAVIYGLTTAFANYPSEWYASLLLNNTNFVTFVVNNTANKTMSAPTFNSLEKTILMVNVYYDELFYTNIDDEPKLPFENFIALVGGHLGLFLGMSILSLIEIVEIIFLIVFPILHLF